MANIEYKPFVLCAHLILQTIIKLSNTFYEYTRSKYSIETVKSGPEDT